MISGMIQEIYPHKFDNHYKPGERPDDADILFVFSGGRVLCRTEDGGVSFPHVSECDSRDALIYLFSIDKERFFLGPEGETGVSGDYEYTELRSLRKKDAGKKYLVFAAVTAGHLNDWYRSNRFCGCCGHKLRHAGTERAMVCPSCGMTIYPRINPAVIVAVTNGDRLLLTKYSGRSYQHYALVAGFTEIGETFEETVKREVMEETGLEVGNIRYYKSQPWGFASDILAGYFCDVKGSTQIHLDDHELREAVWVPRKEIPDQPDEFSLTNEMMMVFREGYN